MNNGLEKRLSSQYKIGLSKYWIEGTYKDVSRKEIGRKIKIRRNKRLCKG
ncbi:hypothetical protein [Clostridium diolis]